MVFLCWFLPQIVASNCDFIKRDRLQRYEERIPIWLPISCHHHHTYPLWLYSMVSSILFCTILFSWAALRCSLNEFFQHHSIPVNSRIYKTLSSCAVKHSPHTKAVCTRSAWVKVDFLSLTSSSNVAEQHQRKVIGAANRHLNYNEHCHHLTR